jgi:hypothetical protein
MISYINVFRCLCIYKLAQENDVLGMILYIQFMGLYTCKHTYVSMTYMCIYVYEYLCIFLSIHIVTVEEGSKGGFGDAVMNFLSNEGILDTGIYICIYMCMYI